VSPSEGEVVDETPVSLVFNAVIDTDNEDVTYELEVATSEDFAAPLLTVEGFSGEEDQIAVELEGPEEDAQHWARVRAWDTEGAGPWAVVSFFVDAINSPPTTVALTSPEDGARLLPGPIDFAWEPATDPEGGALTYTINLFGDAGLSALVWSRSAVDATSETWEAPAEAQTYFWTVTAADDQGLEGPSGGPGEFTVALMANQGPGAPTPTSPVDDAVVDPAGVILVAAAATDPEEDTLSYEFEVFSDDGLADRVFLEGGITGQGDSAYATVSGLPEKAARYWWRVRAGDQEVLGPWSNTATFLTGALDSEDSNEDDPMDGGEAAASTGDSGCATAPGHPTWIALLALGAFLFRRRQ
jgi:MYXO-CTERM domain-containing protein